MPTTVDIKNLKINKLTEAQYDTAVQGGVIGENELSVLTDAELEQIQVSALPTASADELGKIYQYIGATDSTYTNGYFYKCVSDGQTPATYSWTQTDVQPNSGGLPDQTGNSGKFLTTDGTDASWATINALTNQASGNNLAIGTGSYTLGGSTQSVAVGKSAGVYGDFNVAIGESATIGAQFNYKSKSIAIGRRAQCTANYAIMLNASGGWATNADNNTFKIANENGNYEIMSADGTIPTDRFTTTPSTDGDYVPTLTIASGVATRSWAAPSGGGGAGHNVGDIFLTMRNDNELNGAVECDGLTYNTTDFTGAQSIGNLLADGKVPYVSMATYATEISTKGWCDKFGWDGAGNTQFKVPTLSAYIWQKLQTSVVGTGKTLGLVCGQYELGLGGFQSGLYPTFAETQGTNTGSGASGKNYNAGDKTVGITTNATNSGMVAGSASDVSQQRCMVQLATSASDEAMETCTSVLADVATLKGYDYVVDFQAPTAANNYTWYRKYKSGWVEQGGQMTGVGSSYTTKTIPVEMSDTNYTLITSTSSSFSGNNYAVSNPVSETTFQVKYSGTGTANVCWQISGMAAN